VTYVKDWWLVMKMELLPTNIGYFSSQILGCNKLTRHRANTSMYSLTFCVRVIPPERHQWKSSVQASAVMLRRPPPSSTASHRPASHAHLPYYTVHSFENEYWGTSNNKKIAEKKRLKLRTDDLLIFCKWWRHTRKTQPNSLLSVECWQLIMQQHIGIMINVEIGS